MNKKVFNYVIALLWMIMVLLAILKLCFAESFIAVAANQRVIDIGNFIDSTPIIKLIADVIMGVLIMHFYLCACKQVWKLSICEYLVVIVYSISITLLRPFLPVLINLIDFAAPIVLPFLLKCRWKQIGVIFVLHNLGQLMTVFIRSEELYQVSLNYATVFVFAFDMYVWLGVYYIYSNVYKEDTLWDGLLRYFSEIKQKQNSKKSLRK